MSQTRKLCLICQTNLSIYSLSPIFASKRLKVSNHHPNPVSNRHKFPNIFFVSRVPNLFRNFYHNICKILLGRRTTRRGFWEALPAQGSHGMRRSVEIPESSNSRVADLSQSANVDLKHRKYVRDNSLLQSWAVLGGQGKGRKRRQATIKQ